MSAGLNPNRSFPPPGFRVVDWNAPINVESLLAATPADITAKGMFFQDLVQKLGDRAGDWREKKYTAFKDYPIREFMELVTYAAEVLYPVSSLREGLRRLGQQAYPVFKESLVGRVVFAAVSNDPRRILEIGSKAYKVGLSRGGISIVDSTEDSVTVHFHELYHFADCYHIGNMESVLQACGKKGRVAYRPQSICDADVYLQW